MKRILMILAVALVAVACNKNQSAVKKLDGEWNVTKMLVTEDGKSLDLISLGADVKFNFTACKLKDNEFCDMTISTTNIDGSVDTENLVFKVTNDGTSLIQAESDTSTATTTTDIIELSKSNAKLQYSEEGGTTDIEMEKL